MGATVNDSDKQPTVLFSGRHAGSLSAAIGPLLTTDWTIRTWTPRRDAEADLIDALRNARAIIAPTPPGPWPETTRLRLYQIPFAGSDHLAPERIPAGVPVCNVSEHESAIAEYVLLAMLEWRLRVGPEARRFRAHGWEGMGPSDGPKHDEILGASVGIVGHGRIGREVARRARAFGMRTLGVARTARETPAELDWYGTVAALPTLLAESDFVVVACPLSPETEGLINAAAFAAMRPDAVLINVARGAVVDEEALYRAVSEQRIGGAVIDVWYTYPDRDDPSPPPSRFPFQTLENVVMTPHNSGWTHAMQDRRHRAMAANLDRVSRGEPPRDVVFVGTG